MKRSHLLTAVAVAAVAVGAAAAAVAAAGGGGGRGPAAINHNTAGSGASGTTGAGTQPRGDTGRTDTASDEGWSQVACGRLSAPADPSGPTGTTGVTGASATPTDLAGLLEIPSLGVTAPVLQGLGDQVLAMAVGHDPDSPWPGIGGVSLLEAHDVSYFAQIDQLQPGALVQWTSGCEVTTFRVVSTEISSPGGYIYPPASGRGLTLVTCSPTDALWWTSDRYVVETSYVSSRPSAAKVEVPSVRPPDFTVPAPASLVAMGLTLASNDPLLGTLNLAGDPSQSFRSSPLPLDVSQLALESYFGAQKAIAAGSSAWWQAIAAPGVAMPAAWSTAAPLDLVIDVDGSKVSGVTITSSYVEIHLNVAADKLLIASVDDG